VDEVAEQHAASARLRGIELIVRYPRGLPETFLGDPGRIRQVLVNLVGNAVKFTASGHVLIDVASALGRAVRIEVQDTGIGIPAEQLERVFERYTQANASTARRYGGSGLGLSISRQLVELMGGTISVRSTEGVGSTFSLVLPLKRTVAPDPATLTGMRVLVAEDNESNQLVASHLLSRAGCRVEVAGNGVEVLRKLEEQPYDLVLMDCHMPELDGYETATAIRRSDAPWGGVRIVAVTASAMADDRDLCLASGMDGYVSKPLRVDEVRGAVKRGRARSPSSRTGVGGARGSEGAPRCSR